jgi:hypothetical protein
MDFGRNRISSSMQCLRARQHTVVRVRERKQRHEGEGPLATGTATTTNANPIVMLIMRLLGAASVTDDRVNFTRRALPQNSLVAARGPTRFEGRQNRSIGQDSRDDPAVVGVSSHEEISPSTRRTQKHGYVASTALLGQML